MLTKRAADPSRATVLARWSPLGRQPAHDDYRSTDWEERARGEAIAQHAVDLAEEEESPITREVETASADVGDRLAHLRASVAIGIPQRHESPRIAALGRRVDCHVDVAVVATHHQVARPSDVLRDHQGAEVREEAQTAVVGVALDGGRVGAAGPTAKNWVIGRSLRQGSVEGRARAGHRKSQGREGKASSHCGPPSRAIPVSQEQSSCRELLVGIDRALNPRRVSEGERGTRRPQRPGKPRGPSSREFDRRASLPREPPGPA